MTECATTAALSGSAYPGGSLSGNEKYDSFTRIEDVVMVRKQICTKNDQMKTWW